VFATCVLPLKSLLKLLALLLSPFGSSTQLVDGEKELLLPELLEELDDESEDDGEYVLYFTPEDAVGEPQGDDFDTWA